MAHVFGGHPNTSFSQNVGMAGIMRRHVITIGAIILVVCGFLPKIGAVIASVSLSVLGGGVIVLFGMVAAAGLNMLAGVTMNRRNVVIIAVSLAFGLGLNLLPIAVQYLPGVLHTMAVIAIVLNQVLPEDIQQGNISRLRCRVRFRSASAA